MAPANQVTDQFEASTSYSSRGLQAKLAYQVSLFHNDDPALTCESNKLGKASRKGFTDPGLAKDYADLIAWRDALYEAHRPKS